MGSIRSFVGLSTWWINALREVERSIIAITSFIDEKCVL